MSEVASLKAYLQRPDVSVGKFADDMGVSRVTVWRWANGKADIALSKAFEVERYTNGAVRASDFEPPAIPPAPPAAAPSPEA